eukprot:COSAG04_NODE_665_length_11421_cov_11.971383_3_plen_576_part_00
MAAATLETSVDLQPGPTQEVIATVTPDAAQLLDAATAAKAAELSAKSWEAGPWRLDSEAAVAPKALVPPKGAKLAKPPAAPREKPVAPGLSTLLYGDASRGSAYGHLEEPAAGPAASDAAWMLDGRDAGLGPGRLPEPERDVSLSQHVWGDQRPGTASSEWRLDDHEPPIGSLLPEPEPEPEPTVSQQVWPRRAPTPEALAFDSAAGVMADRLSVSRGSLYSSELNSSSRPPTRELSISQISMFDAHALDASQPTLSDDAERLIHQELPHEASFRLEAEPGEFGALPGERGRGTRSFDTWLDHSSSALFLNELLSPQSRETRGPERAATPDMGPPRTSLLSRDGSSKQQRAARRRSAGRQARADRWTAERFEILSQDKGVRRVGNKYGGLQMAPALESQLRRAALDKVSRLTIASRRQASRQAARRQEGQEADAVRGVLRSRGSLPPRARTPDGMLGATYSHSSLSGARKSRDYCWHLGCMLQRVPATIVRAGWFVPTADGDAAEAAEGAGGQRQVLVQASAPSVSSRTGRQSPRTEAAVRLVVQEQRSKQRAAAVPRSAARRRQRQAHSGQRLR